MRSFACFFTRRLFQAILLSLIASSTVGFAEADLPISGYQTAAGATIRFVDAATGFSVAPDEVIQSLDEFLENVSVRAEGYRPFNATIPTEKQPKRLQFVLEPLVRPEPLRSESIDARRQQDATLFLGYVAADEFGGPLSGVRVESFPSGVMTETDENGFFALAVPLQSEEEAAVSPAGLLFKKNGYDLEEIRGIELFPYGDWTYRIRLRRGDGIRVTDENLLRRRESPHFSLEEAASTPAPVLSGERISAAADPRSTSTSVETISVPTNIRVLLADGETIEYVPMELYVRRSLPSEWIASWGNYSGGEHSLRAGAVAIRTYAIGFVKNPRDAHYDICGTAVCQVYGSRENSLTDAAVNATSHYVMVNSSGRITFKLTEYSAENNSLGFSCGDGFTSPTGGCLADPVCAGQERYGHGRGLCQWGTARWATGRRMHERRTGDATPHGYPTKNWIELLQHYYPDLTLVQGAPLSTGDTVRVVGNGSRAVRLCAGGGIENGENCPLIATKTAGATGIIVDGPQLVAADGFGYTWWKIKWDDAEGTTGWTAENWLERIVPPPSAPVGLSAVALSSTEIELSWNSSGGSVSGFRVERSTGGGGWSGIDTVSADARTYFDSGLQPVSEYSYRIRAFNSGGNSPPSNVVTITTPDFPPTLDPIADQAIDVGELLSFAVNATAPERIFRITDFEQFGNGTPSGTVLFRAPSFSGSTDPLLHSSPNISSVRSDFPAGNESTRALYVAWSWGTVSNPWLRLTTSNVASFGNPVIDFTKRFRFRIHTDRDLKIALGLRETNTKAGTTLGSNGGSNGGIEFVGASGKTGAAPVPVRTIAGGSWTVVEFDLPNEPVVNYANGNGVLESSTGLGVLEHLAFVPADGSGKYEIYLDDFEQVEDRKIIFALGSDAPVGALIDPETAVFTWTPSAEQGDQTHEITILATTAGPHGQTVAETFLVTVRSVRQIPVLDEIADRTVHPGETVHFTATLSEPDPIPENLIFELDSTAPSGAQIDPVTGTFFWTTELSHAGEVFPVTILAIDNGNPPLEGTADLNIHVTEPLTIETISANENEISLIWNGIEGAIYRLQTTTDLGQPWVDLSLDLVANESPMIVTIPVESDQPKRFFRIQTISRESPEP